MSMSPLVTFVVPCYKLAHLLPECIRSLQAQTYQTWEALIMDDCSPDATPEVAASFGDPRVRHIRNEPNLGHLRNYNKGIGLAQGRYVWLISADDCLRSPAILERFVRLMEANPRAGYVFCPAVGLRNGKESGVLEYSVHGNRDTVFDGRRFLCELIKENTIVAATGMVRRDCYDRLGMFPLDMPWAGDWYLWCLFALHYDVGYCAEPMVCYREHELSMTTQLMQRAVGSCAAEDLLMPWNIKQKAEALGHRDVSQACLRAAAEEYARRIASQRYKAAHAPLTIEQFEELVDRQDVGDAERRQLRGRVYASIADRYFWRDELALAAQYYVKATVYDSWRPSIWVKRLLAAAGPFGRKLRRSLPAARRFVLGQHHA